MIVDREMALERASTETGAREVENLVGRLRMAIIALIALAGA